MSRPSLGFLKYLLGLRRAHSAVSGAERDLLVTLIARSRRAVEVGVFEGVTSAALAAGLPDGAQLVLVDPFVPGTRPERWLGISYAYFIARRSVRHVASRVSFTRMTSVEAAERMTGEVDFVFIDADHSYDAVKGDFLAWTPRLSARGVMALHDSRRCRARPDLTETTGPVQLSRELESGVFGPWRLVAEVDSVSAFERSRDVDR